MTAKDKAIELVEKMAFWHWKSDVCDFESAKQCAIIAVDEIIKEYGTYYKIEVDGKYVSYWEEVKQEINSL